MKLESNILITVVASLLLFSGCSKEVEEYNKPAAYWYSKVISSVAKGDVEKADNYYSSLQGEHIGSPLLPEATLILAIAHMHYEEYLLSEHFSDEYMKRYANVNEREFTEFLKIKAKYMALPNPRRDQVLIQDAIKESKIFKMNYPRSMYYPVVDTMLTNLTMAEAALNESIADLYVRLDKPRSAEYYRNKKAQKWVDFDEIDRANSPWYREWFEGDGTQSWYAFMIPDTKSVVSRNTLYEEYVSLEQNGTVMEVAPIEEVVGQEDKYYAETKTRLISAEQEKDIQRAKELMAKGALTQEEYKAIRDEILDEGSITGSQASQENMTQTQSSQNTTQQEPVEEMQESEKPWYEPWFGTDDKIEDKTQENTGSWYNFNSWF